MDLFVLDLPDGENLDFQIALVDDPATESDWIAFSKTPTKQQEFKIQSEHKRIVSGYAMIADLEIPRFDKVRGAYNVVFKKENIEKIWLNFQRQNLNTNTNIMHQTNEFAKGVFVCESFIIDSERGIKAPEGFETEADGSWFISMKIEDEQVWEQVLNGSFNGFSVEGRFHEKDSKEFSKEEITEIKSFLKTNKMSEKLKDKLKAFFTTEEEVKKFETVLLVDGETEVTIEPAIEVGAAIVIMDAEGNPIPAPISDYELQDGRVIVVEEDGVIAEVKEVEAGEEAEAAEDMGDENQEQQKVKKIIERIESEMIFEKIAELFEKVEAIEKVNEFLKAENEEFKKQLVDHKADTEKIAEDNKGEFESLKTFTQEAFELLNDEPVKEPVKTEFNPFKSDKKVNIFLNKNKN
jgi:hypothetical protein